MTQQVFVQQAIVYVGLLIVCKILGRCLLALNSSNSQSTSYCYCFCHQWLAHTRFQLSGFLISINHAVSTHTVNLQHSIHQECTQEISAFSDSIAAILAAAHPWHNPAIQSSSTQEKNKKVKKIIMTRIPKLPEIWDEPRRRPSRRKCHQLEQDTPDLPPETVHCSSTILTPIYQTHFPVLAV